MTNKLYALAFLFLFMVIPHKQTDPARVEWIAYGQTLTAAQTGIDNPPAHHLGVVGEVDLPYTVPDGYELHLVAWGVEAYDFSGTVVIAPWIGDYPRTAAKFLHSCAASTGSVDCDGMHAILPAGTKVNGRLINGENVQAVYSWYFRGWLEEVTE